MINILNVIGVSPEDFFAKLYAPGRGAQVPLTGNREVKALRKELDDVKVVLGGLLSFLEGKGVFDAAELAAATEKARASRADARATND